VDRAELLIERGGRQLAAPAAPPEGSEYLTMLTGIGLNYYRDKYHRRPNKSLST
jgi:hypothetical protein